LFVKFTIKFVGREFGVKFLLSTLSSLMLEGLLCNTINLHVKMTMIIGHDDIGFEKLNSNFRFSLMLHGCNFFSLFLHSFRNGSPSTSRKRAFYVSLL